MINFIMTKLLDLEGLIWKSEAIPKFLSRILRATALVIRGLVAERPVMRSAALTYTTTLTLIPTLAMVFGVMDFLRLAEDYQDEILNKLGSFMTESAALQVQEVILESVGNLNGGGLAGISLVLVLLGAMTLISNVEQAFNTIWGIQKLRPFILRFMSYLAILTTTPLALLIPLFLLSAKNLGYLDHIPVIGSFLQSTIAAFVPFLVIWLFFFLLYYVIPNVKVSISAALAGGLMASVFFGANQVIAGFLLNRFSSFSVIYGSMATVPIFLLSLFVIWMIILLGAQVAYAWENVEGFRREYLLEQVSNGDEEVIAFRLMKKMAHDFVKKGQPLDYEQIAEQWELPSRLLRSLLDKLEEGNLVHRLGERETLYVPGKELNQIHLSDVIEVVRFGSKGLNPERYRETEKFHQVYRAVALPESQVAQKTLRDVVQGDSK